MTIDDRIFLEANRPHYTTLVIAGFLKNLDYSVRERMLNIIRDNFASNYLTSLWCSTCVVDMVKYLYTQYDKWLAEQPDDMIIKHDTFPKQN